MVIDYRDRSLFLLKLIRNFKAFNKRSYRLRYGIRVRRPLKYTRSYFLRGFSQCHISRHRALLGGPLSTSTEVTLDPDQLWKFVTPNLQHSDKTIHHYQPALSRHRALLGGPLSTSAESAQMNYFKNVDRR